MFGVADVAVGPAVVAAGAGATWPRATVISTAISRIVVSRAVAVLGLAHWLG